MTGSIQSVKDKDLINMTLPMIKDITKNIDIFREYKDMDI